MTINYYQFCQEIYSNWLNGFIIDEYLEKYFDLTAMPEPYLIFGNSANPVYFLTTNPGQVLEFQLIKEGVEDYMTRAGELANWYAKHLTVKAARNRIDKMWEITRGLKRDGFVQLEVVPFHSASLRRKKSLPLSSIRAAYIWIITVI